MKGKKTHKGLDEPVWGLDEPVWGLDEPCVSRILCVKSVSNVKYTPLQNTMYATYTKCKKEHISALSYIVMSVSLREYPRLESNQHKSFCRAPLKPFRHPTLLYFISTT